MALTLLHSPRPPLSYSLSYSPTTTTTTTPHIPLLLLAHSSPQSHTPGIQNRPLYRPCAPGRLTLFFFQMLSLWRLAESQHALHPARPHLKHVQVHCNGPLTPAAYDLHAPGAR